MQKPTVTKSLNVLSRMVLPPLLLAGGWSHAHANLLPSPAFEFNYEMDAAPSASDLDTNLIPDFYSGASTNPGDVLNNAVYAGGIATIRDNGVAANTSVFRTDTGGSIWRNNFLSDDTWMAEIRVRVNVDPSFPEGAAGTLLVSGGIAGTSPILRIHQNSVDFSTTGNNYTTYLSGTDFTAGFHTFLVGRNGPEGWLWVDNVLIASQEPLISGLSGGHGNGFFVGGATFSGSVKGAYEIDYIRLSTGFSTVPEPSAFSLLLGGFGLLVTLRQRLR